MKEDCFRLVFAKHPENEKNAQEYIFSVPPYFEVHKGDVLLVDTTHESAIAIATCEPFISINPNELAMKLGAYLPLRRVLQAAGPDIQKHITKKARDEIIQTVELVDSMKEDDLPY